MSSPVRAWRLADIAELLKQNHPGLMLQGDADCQITGLHTLAGAGDQQLSFLANPRYKSALKETRAAAVLLRAEDADGYTGNAIVLAQPYAAYAQLAAYFDRTPRPEQGVHSSALVSATAQIDASASIGPLVVIGDDVVIGAGSVIDAGAVIHARVSIGRNSRVRSNAVIYHDCVLGDRVNIHSGAVIGGDGFGFANHQGRWHKIAQIGRVVIHNDVDIGANTTVDRGALDDTVIHEGVIIDNLVQIAHNVVIGAHTAIAGCCGIAGSTRIGKHCVLAGGVGVAGHLVIADNVQFTGMTIVTKSISQAGSYSSGTGFEPTEQWRRTAVRVRQLDDMAKRLRELEAQVQVLSDKTAVK